MPAEPLPTASGRRFEAAAADPGAFRPAAAPGALADPGLLDLADQCVMCGLCLPHCPTYRLSLDEAESPRGRIAVARSLASGRIAPDPLAFRHLDQCLACLSCEKVCPSEVDYGEILTRSRAAQARVRTRGFLDRMLGDPQRLVALARLGAWFRADRWLPALGRRLSATSRLGALAREVPAAPTALRAPAPNARGRGAIALFRGCVASVYDRDTHDAARILLEALGYDVRIPEGTPCCGTLARHAGDAAAADREAAATCDALAATGASIALVSATGCFGELRDRASAQMAIVDVHAFLARDAELSRLRFRPLAARAALHLPCTQVNVVGEVASIRALLARIPTLDVIELPLQPRCCGAAGGYFAEHPAIATRLRDEKLDQALETAPDLVLTTNIGCRLHLAAGVRERGVSPRVMHPLALLAQQLENGEP